MAEKLKPCPYDRAVRCIMDEPCDGCETKCEADLRPVICSACGNSWTRDQYESEMVAAYPLGVEDVSPNWCPSCGEDGEVEEVRDG